MAKEYAKTRKLKWELWPSLSNIPDILSAAKVFSVAHAWSLKAIEKGENLNKELVNKVSNKAKEMNTETRFSEYQIADLTSAAYAYAKKNPSKPLKISEEKTVLFAIKGPTSLKGTEGIFPILGKVLVKETDQIVESKDADLVFMYSATKAFWVECRVKAEDVSGKDDPNEDDDDE